VVEDERRGDRPRGRFLTPPGSTASTEVTSGPGFAVNGGAASRWSSTPT
jgi:hypothetical protein